MKERFQADIGANIRDFQRKLKQVDAQIRKAASGADVQIAANIRKFLTKMAAIDAKKKQLQSGETEVTITAAIRGFVRGAALVKAQALALGKNRIVIPIRAKWDGFRNVMGSIANFQRNIDEITGSMGRGGLLLLSPAMVPVIASAVGLLGQLGPMLGTVAGSTFALATSMGAAGAGLLGFAAVATPTIKDLFDMDEAIGRGTKQWRELSQETRTALNSIDNFQGNWGKFREQMDKPVTVAFTDFMQAANKYLNLFKPAIESAVTGVSNLMKSFEEAAGGAQVKSFFEWLGTTAGQHIETIGKALGNFLLGFMNMMVAFGPLAQTTADGFLKMGEGFAQWAAGLSESEKFQTFVTYVQENMPKVRSIFSDAIQGMINMFAGFAPSSENMMTGLENLMERFKKWSATIGENQGFQKFIDYVQTNGPVVVSTIGNLITFIVNLGIALAPVGAWMLEMVNSFLKWANSMLQAHPWLGKIAAGALILIGALMAFAPIAILVNSVFSGLILMMAKVLVKLAVTAVIWTAKWALMAAKSLFHGARIATAWLLTTGAGMVVALAKMAVSATIFIAKWALMGVQALLHAAKVAGAWLITTGVSMVTALAKMAVTATIFVAKWALMATQSLLQAARMAAAWFIALGPVGWITGIIIGLVILVIANWDKISAWTSKTWSAISNYVVAAVTVLMSLISSRFPALYSIISSYMTMAQSIISAVWSYIKGTFSNTLAFLKALVKGDFSGMKTAIQNQMELAKSTIQRIWDAVKGYLTTLLGVLLSKFGEMFAKIVSKIREKMGEGVKAVTEFVGKMPGEVLSFVGDMLSAGSDLVSGLIDGIKNMGTSAINAITGVVDGVVGKAKSLLKIKSPSRVFREMGQYVSEGLAIGVQRKSRMAVDNVARMASSMSNAFNPQLAMADMHASAQLDTSLNRADMGIVRKSFAAEIDPVEVYQGDTVLQIDKREFARWTADDIKKEMDRNEYQRNASRRGTN